MCVLQFCGQCWVFQIYWHTEWNTFTTSSFRILNSSVGIPSPPLVLFVMFPKAHLISLSRMSGYRWVITPSRLSGSWSSFLYSSSVYSCQLFLMPYASVMSIPFLSFIKPIFALNVPLLSLNFLKRSLVFPILLFSSICLHWSWRKAIHEWSSSFPYFLQFKSEFANTKFMTWATVLFLLTVKSFSIFGCKEYNQYGINHLVMPMCRVFSCVVGRGCLLWPVHDLGKTLLAFALLHSVLQGQICLLLQVFIDFLLLHSSPL